MGQQFLFVHTFHALCCRWWCSAASIWSIGEVAHVSTRHRKCSAHTLLFLRRRLVERKVRWMQKVDKLHITANKGAGEQHCCSQSLDLSHMTNDTDRCWIIHVISVQKPQIHPLKGRLVFFFPQAISPVWPLDGGYRFLHLSASRWHGWF